MTLVPAPDRIVAAPDGVPIAVFESGLAAHATDHPTVVLVHGTTADHTTFRALAPVLGLTRHLVAIDRRGRGASGDGRGEYSIEHEYDDLAAVARTVAVLEGRAVDVLGHSYGGRIALGAALRSEDIRRLVVYEGAPPVPGQPYRPPGLERDVQRRLARGDGAAALETFFRRVVGLDDEAIAAYRANPVWPARVAAAQTVLRELEAEGSDAASLEALAAVMNPTLLVLGTASREPFRAATEALEARLARATVLRIEGAAHAAHHTHVPELALGVEAFLDPARPDAGRASSGHRDSGRPLPSGS
ncbi:MAG TPA: alpha/beta fold hydrolase [Candidatus Limnocylindrales bacterium]|nr:alpha/beta fold hydrolase [Candidatus Limnocylindrales bacterium]